MCHVFQNERRTVQMMFQEGYFNMAFIEEQKMKVIELPYFNNELSMFILLPEVVCEDFTGLEQVIFLFLSSSIHEWQQTEQYNIASVWLEDKREKLNRIIFSFHSLWCQSLLSIRSYSLNAPSHMKN